MLNTYARHERFHDHCMDDMVDAPIEKDVTRAANANMDINTYQSLKSLMNRIGMSSMSTSFSGIDSPGTAAVQLTACLNNVFGISGEHPRHLFAVEWEPTCQQELCCHPGGPECLFSDIEEFLTPLVRRMIPEWHRTKKINARLLPLVKESYRKLLNM